MQVVAKKRSQNVFAKFAGGLMASKGNEPDAVALAARPLSVKPRPGHHKVRVVGIILFGMAKNLPRSPRIFLIPESGNI